MAHVKSHDPLSTVEQHLRPAFIKRIGAGPRNRRMEGVIGRNHLHNIARFYRVVMRPLRRPDALNRLGRRDFCGASGSDAVHEIKRIKIAENLRNIEKSDNRTSVAQRFNESLRRKSDQRLPDWRTRNIICAAQLGFIEQRARFDFEIKNRKPQMLVNKRGGCTARALQSGSGIINFGYHDPAT